MLRNGLVIPCLLQEKEAHCEGTSKDIIRNFQLLHEGKVCVTFRSYKLRKYRFLFMHNLSDSSRSISDQEFIFCL
jgi:hypothetical protein